MVLMIGAVFGMVLFQLCQISTATNDTACQQPLVTGPCKARLERWGYNGRECVKFVYGNCQGNENNFETKSQCDKKCNGVINPCTEGYTKCAPCQRCRKIWDVPCAIEGKCTSKEVCENACDYGLVCNVETGKCEANY